MRLSGTYRAGYGQRHDCIVLIENPLYCRYKWNPSILDGSDKTSDLPLKLQPYASTHSVPLVGLLSYCLFLLLSIFVLFAVINIITGNTPGYTHGN